MIDTLIAEGIITTIAGTGTAGSNGDGGLAINALLNKVTGVWVDINNKNIYIVDYANFKIRMVTNSTGMITTIAGTGTVGSTGDGGPATSAQLNYPQAVTMNSYGNIFIADSSNHKIRMVNSAGIIITIAGTGTVGGLGDCGVAASAQLNYPSGVWVDMNDNVYVADTTNHKIRLVWPQVSTFPSVCDFENVVSTTSFVYYVIGSVVGGWATGGIYSVGLTGGAGSPGGGIGILSTQNSIGFASPFPSNLQYACWIATINNAQSFITRTATGVLVGYAYFVSFWITCRSGYLYPPSQSFTVVMDGVTVYSTSPSSTSWVLVTSATNTALHTSMTLMFQLSNLGGSDNDYGMAVDEVALKRALSSRPTSQPTIQPTTRPSKASRAPNMMSLTVNVSNVMTTFAGSGTYPSYLNATYPGSSIASVCCTVASPGYCTLSCPRPGCTITSIIYATLANNVGSCPLLVQGTPSTTPSSPLYSTGPPNPVSSPVYLPPSPLLPVPPPVVASPAGSTSTSSSAGPTVAATNLPTTTSPVSTCTVDFTADATTACIGQQACVVSSNRGDPAWIPCDAGSVNYLTIVATYNFLGDGGPATNAVLRRPYGVSFRSNVGDLFITDTTAQLIRTVSAFSGLISTIVGIPNACGAPSSELNLAGTTTKLCYPYDVVTDQSGNCYIADRNNHRIRMWTASTGMVATFAGYGFAGFTSDNVAATSAALNYPSGVTLDSGGNVYISDTNNNAIRRVDILTNIITTIVGYYRMATYGGDWTCIHCLSQ